MTWKTIRNENNEIVRRELTESIYIERRFVGNFVCDKWDNTLVVEGCAITWSTSEGYTMKELKAKGEQYLAD